MGTMNWVLAVEDARELAEAAKKSEVPEKYVLALAKCVNNLCDAIEEIAEHVKIPCEEPEKSLMDEQKERNERVKEAARNKAIERLQQEELDA